MRPLPRLQALLAALAITVLGTGTTLLVSDADAAWPSTASSHHLDAGAGTDWTTAASSQAWPADAIFYHVFMDRFADGDRPDTQVAGDPDDPGYPAALTDWMGGDLAGVRARLDHVVASGANTLWLSPVTPGPAFHGYHPTELRGVDPRFGDVEELRGLIADAQELGLRVVYDLVLNHTSDRHPHFLDAISDCAASPFVDWYRFTSCPDTYAAFAGLPELPQVDLDHPAARAYVLDEVLPFYLDDLGVDGFRLDHVEGPSRDFWRTLRAEIDDRWPGTLLLGEVWAQPAVIASYGDVLDAATAFPLRDRLEATFARGGDVRAVSMAVARMLGPDGLLDPARPVPQTYLSSHDQPRFTHLADGDRAATALAYAAVLTLPGIPTLYYGDEVGMAQTASLPDGADFADRWFREPMSWDETGWDADLWRQVAELARERAHEPALHLGSYTEVVGAGEVWVFLREQGDERVLVAINTAASAVALDELLVEQGGALDAERGVASEGSRTTERRGLSDTEATTPALADLAALLERGEPVARIGAWPSSGGAETVRLPPGSALVLRLPSSTAVQR